MTTRREILGAGAGLAFVGCSLLASQPAGAQARRQTLVSGRRVKVIDVHAHCVVPEALELMGQKLGGLTLRPDLSMAATVSQRVRGCSNWNATSSSCRSFQRSGRRLIEVVSTATLPSPKVPTTRSGLWSWSRRRANTRASLPMLAFSEPTNL